MKLTESIIDQLIAEQIEKLDEKTAFPFDTDLKIFGNAKAKTNTDDTTLKNRIDNLAKLDGNNADVSIDDLRKGAKKTPTSDEYKAVVNVKVAGRNEFVRGIAAKALDGTLPAKSGIGDEELGTGQAAEIEPSAGESIPDMELNYSAVDLTSDLAANKLETGGKIDKAIADALSTFFDIDPTILGATSGKNTLGGRFQLLSKFATAVKENDTTLLNNLSDEELMASAVAFKALAAIFIQFQGASAGTVFETFIALITGGGIFGGESGAIDNISGKNGDVYSSAKQYKGKHSTSQATGDYLVNGGKGLIAHCQQALKKGKKVWYISAKKLEESIEIIFGGISVDDAEDPKTFIFYKPDGEPSGETRKVKRKLSSAQFNFTDEIKYAATGQEMYMPIINTSDARKIANVDKMIAATLTNLNKDFLNAAMKSSKEVDLLTKQNLSYTTEKDELPSATKAAEIGETYTRLKNAFNTMFTSKSQSAITENKNKINENNLENILDKLIQEVILTK